jgi:spermidine/putrescine transport system substrate-binding protein
MDSLIHHNIIRKVVEVRPGSLVLAIPVAFALIWLAAWGGPTAPPTAAWVPQAEELIFYNWAEYIPQSVLDAFTDEYGVKVTYLTYESQEEAVANIEKGEVYDVAIIKNEHILSLAEEGLLAEIDYRNVPNFNNISADFRDLGYDRGNKYSIPFSWGTTGLVVRSDLVDKPVTRWADLWDPRYRGRVALRGGSMREGIGAALKSLGYSINSENPDELEAALVRLLALKSGVVFVHTYTEGAVPRMLNGDVAIMVGWAEDVIWGRAENDAITFVFPEEGVFVWGDNLVIPANSPHKPSAELFLNFLLRPEVSGQIASQNHYSTANEKAYPFIDSELLKDSVAFPTKESLKNAEVLLPLSEEGRNSYEEIWGHFMAAHP